MLYDRGFEKWDNAVYARLFIFYKSVNVWTEILSLTAEKWKIAMNYLFNKLSQWSLNKSDRPYSQSNVDTSINV